MRRVENRFTSIRLTEVYILNKGRTEASAAKWIYAPNKFPKRNIYIIRYVCFENEWRVVLIEALGPRESEVARYLCDDSVALEAVRPRDKSASIACGGGFLSTRDH